MRLFHPSKTRRFAIRYSLRFLFALLLLCAAASMWLQRQIKMLDRQRRAMQRLSAIDARIETEPAFPAWLWRYLPRSLCSNSEIAVSVEIIRDRLVADEIAPIADLTSVRSVTIRGDGPTDSELARTVASLQNLIYANLPEVGVSDECMRALTASKHLSQLYLTYARPSRKGLLSLASLRDLRTLDVSRARIDDGMFEPTLSMTALTSIHLPESLSAESLRQLPKLNGLLQLELRLATAGNEGLANLWLLPKLRVLDIHGPGLTDAGLSHIRKIKTLEKLRIWSAQLTVDGVTTLADMSALRIVHIRDSGIMNTDQAALWEAFPHIGPRGLHASDTRMKNVKSTPRRQRICPAGYGSETPPLPQD